jgi:hypothetical protein
MGHAVVREDRGKSFQLSAGVFQEGRNRNEYEVPCFSTPSLYPLPEGEGAMREDRNACHNLVTQLRRFGVIGRDPMTLYVTDMKCVRV